MAENRDREELSGLLADRVVAAWAQICAALEAADGEGAVDELPGEPEIGFRPADDGPVVVLFRFGGGERILAAEAGAVLDCRRSPDGSPTLRVLSPKGALIATVPMPASGAASLN